MRTKLCLVFLLLLRAVTAMAQLAGTGNYHLKHFTDENGLPQNSVKFIVPDNAGFLWLATENGLVRFDGTIFSTFSSSRIRYIYRGSGGKGLYADTHEHQVFGIHGGRAELLPDTPHQHDYGDYEYLIANDTAGVFPATGLPNVYMGVMPFRKYAIPAGPGAFFSISNDSIVFLQHNRPLYRFAWCSPDPWSFFTVGHRLYRLQENGRMLMFRGSETREVKILGDALPEPLSVRQLYWNFTAGQLFIYQEDKCYHLTPGPEGTLFAKLILSGFEREKNDIVSVYYDHTHERVFLGSRSRGMFILTRKQFNPLVSPGDDDNVFYAQAPFGHNGILTAQGIVFEDDGGTKRIPLLQQIRKGSRYSLVKDRKGHYWYRHSDTVYKFNADMTKLLWYRSFGNGVSQLYIGADDRLWIATEKDGLYYLDVNASSPVPLLFTSYPKNATHIMQETANLLWMSTEKALYRLRLSPFRVDTLREFDSCYVRSLFVPKAGEVWVTTYNKGIFLYRNGRTVHMPEDRLGYLRAAHCIMADDQGYYWITTNKGLFQAARKDLIAYADGLQQNVYYYYYGRHQGMLTNEFNGGCQPCGLKLEDGDLSLPSLDGLLRFNPGRIRPEFPAKPLFISRAMLDTTEITVADKVVLPNNFQRLALQVSTPYFGDPYNLHMYYSTEGGGGNGAWLPVEGNGTIAFSRLRSGTYILRIRKINGFGVNNYTEKVVTIIVQQAWFESLPFRIAAICCIALLIYVYIRLRTAHMRRNNLQLTQRVSERTRELEETLSSLRLSEQQLRKQAVLHQRLVTAITHDIKTPMKYLMLLSQTGEKPDKRTEAMNDALYRMYNMVDNLIQYMKMEAVKGNAVNECVDLHELLEEKAGIFRPIAEIRDVQIHNRAERGVKVPVNRQLLAIVVNNLLDNAVKYTAQGSVSLAATYRQEGMVSIKVTDTGMGIQPEVREWIDRHQAAVADNRYPSVQKGIGLVIVMELLQQINGRLIVHANGEPGTSMEILLRAN